MLLAACQPRFDGQEASFDNRLVGDSCTISGALTVEEVEHVKMGRLQMSDGACLPVSLSANKIEQTLAPGPVSTTLTGRLERSIAFDPRSRIVSFEMRGRRIGVHLCNSVFLLVEEAFGEGLPNCETD